MLKAGRFTIDYLDDAQLFLLPQLACLGFQRVPHTERCLDHDDRSGPQNTNVYAPSW